MSRIRQIKPSWFLDKQLRRGTSADAREFYIGLWMLADDAGYLVWDVERIGAEIYPFDGISARERHVEKWAEQLETLDEKAPHLIVWTCGHARVPKMPGHQRISGTQTFSVGEKHRDICRSTRSRREPPVATDSREREEPPLATNSHGIGRVRNGTVSRAGARAPEGAAPGSEFQQKVPRP